MFIKSCLNLDAAYYYSNVNLELALSSPTDRIVALYF